MPKIIQNLVVLMEQTEKAYDISQQAGNMCLNKFCIDEDAAFELSGVHDLQNPLSYETNDTKILTVEGTAKGKGCLSVNKTVSVFFDGCIS